MKQFIKYAPVLGSGILLVILAVLIFNHFQLNGELEKTEEELSALESRAGIIKLDELYSRQSELEEQLNDTGLRLEEADKIVSQPMGSVNTSSLFFDVSRKLGLEVTELTTNPPVNETLDGLDYSMISLTAKVTGKALDIVNLVSGVNLYLKTGTVKSVIIDIPESASADNASATIELVAYSRG